MRLLSVKKFKQGLIYRLRIVNANMCTQGEKKQQQQPRISYIEPVVYEFQINPFLHSHQSALISRNAKIAATVCFASP